MIVVFILTTINTLEIPSLTLWAPERQPVKRTRKQVVPTRSQIHSAAEKDKLEWRPIHMVSAESHDSTACPNAGASSSGSVS